MISRGGQSSVLLSATEEEAREWSIKKERVALAIVISKRGLFPRSACYTAAGAQAKKG
jgi:hypothetical protein